MEPAPRIYIRSEIYRAVVPPVTRLTQAGWRRFQELPRWDVVRNFVVLYFSVGFIIEGIFGSIPASGLSWVLGVNPHVIGDVFALAIFLFWPAITWLALGQVEHTILSVSLVFIGATYVSHIKQRLVEARAALPVVPATPALAGARPVASGAAVFDGIADAVPADPRR